MGVQYDDDLGKDGTITSQEADPQDPINQMVPPEDAFSVPPAETHEEDAEAGYVADVFSNKIAPIQVKFDESNPRNFSFRNNTGVHLITTFFKGTYRQARINEVIEVMRRNLNNPFIEAVHVLYEIDNPRDDLKKTDAADKLDAKLVTVRVMRQPNYFRLFGYVNAVLERGSIAIVSNSDIYFDHSLRHLKYGHPENKTEWRSVMALSRTRSPDCGKEPDFGNIYDLCSTYIGSHDAFVFAPPVPDFVLQNSHHVQNRLGAENVIIYAFGWSPGYRNHVSNPCKRVRAFHLHCTMERHWHPGTFISRGRHGFARPGVDPEREDTWNLIY